VGIFYPKKVKQEIVFPEKIYPVGGPESTAPGEKIYTELFYLFP
jgi:hypothetical protein